MKIEAFSIYRIAAGWRDFLFLEIVDSDGAVGQSEFTESNGSTSSLLNAVSEITKLSIKSEIRDFEQILFENSARWRQSLPGTLTKAKSAFENAGWDLISKKFGNVLNQIIYNSNKWVENTPFYWSHCPTTRIRAHQFVNEIQIDSNQKLYEFIEKITTFKYKYIKTNVFDFAKSPSVLMPGFGKTSGSKYFSRDSLNSFFDSIKIIQQASNSQISLSIDLNFNLSPKDYDFLGALLAPFTEIINWVEIDFDNLNDFKLFESSILAKNFKICSGENLINNWSLAPLIESSCIDVISIDLLWCGLTEALQIAKTANSYGKKITVHNYYSDFATSMGLVFFNMLRNKYDVELFEFDLDNVPESKQVVTKPIALNSEYLNMAQGLGWGNSLATNSSLFFDSKVIKI
jgi:L-alanine-DL-glutamate epimerase-like enolase superfamily enzyme